MQRFKHFLDDDRQATFKDHVLLIGGSGLILFFVASILNYIGGYI